MKARIAAGAAAVAIGSASAQVAYGGVTTTSPTMAMTPSAPQSYVTVTYSDCPEQSIATMITVTNGITVTYCPECQNKTPATSPVATSPGHTTVYTTTYMSLCPTGLTPATYTVTETCPDATPTWATATDHIPPGFTVTTKTCNTGCGKTPMPVTITEPCGCEATSGVPVSQPNAAATPTPAAAPPAGSAPAGSAPPAASAPPAGGDTPAASTGVSGGSPPVSQISDGQIQAPAATPAPGRAGSNGDVPAGSNGNTPAGPDADTPAGSNGAAAPPYPTTAGSGSGAAACPGPQCAAVASSAPSPADYGNTTGIQSWTGAASTVSTTAGMLSFVAVAVAAFAFAL